MSQQFNPKRVLRQVSKPLLKEFFEREGHPLDVPWDELSNTQVQEVFDAWQGLPEGPRKAIEVVLHDVDEMATSDGVRAIIEEGKWQDEDLTEVLDGMESRHDRAVWTLLNKRHIWKLAVRFAHLENLSMGRYWAKRTGLAAKEPRTDEVGLRELEEAMSAFFLTEQGRGHHCRVEHYQRGGGHDYYFVYLSDYADTYINFDDAGNFQRTAERRAFEVVFAYDRASGTLEMYARGGKKVVEALQTIFSRVILEENLLPDDVLAHPYALDHLLERSAGLPTDPEDGVEQVRIRSMSLAVMGRVRERITLDADPTRGPEHIYEMLDQDLDQRRLPKAILQPRKVVFNLKLKGNGRGRSMSFCVSLPNSCDLKSKREDQRLLGEKCLRKWGIDVTQNA